MRRRASRRVRSAFLCPRLQRASSKPESGSTWKKVLLSLLAIISLGAGAALGFGNSQAPAEEPGTVPAVPVETAITKRADVPLYLQGLGTVQAFNTATVTTRVNGQIQSINFSDGQEVKAGDVLAQIDPRPYRAAYDEAVATKAKDEALFANAKIDLQRYQVLASQNAIAMQMLDTQRATVPS